jgi:hypothetical protein
VTGYHRKHAIRLLRYEKMNAAQERSGRRIYSEAVREASIVIWEVADRICGKRLKPLVPALPESMEKYGHLYPDPDVRSDLLRISAATIDRMLVKCAKERTAGAEAEASPPRSDEDSDADVCRLERPCAGLYGSGSGGPMWRGSGRQFCP